MAGDSYCGMLFTIKCVYANFSSNFFRIETSKQDVMSWNRAYRSSLQKLYKKYMGKVTTMVNCQSQQKANSFALALSLYLHYIVVTSFTIRITFTTLSLSVTYLPTQFTIVRSHE